MSDVFDEVEVQMRAERARAAFARSWPWLLGLLVLILLAVGGWFAWREWRTRQAESASATYQRAVEARGAPAGAEVTGDAARRADTAFASAAEQGTDGYRALALMQRGALALDRRDNAAAVRFFDQAAAAASEPILADAAALQAAYTVLDTAPLLEIERRLTPLRAEGRPYRPLAREAYAVALALAGRTADARREFVVLSLDPDAPESLRTRAEANIQVMDAGGAAALRAITQAATSVPSQAVEAYRAQQQQAEALAQAQAQAAAQARSSGGGPGGPPQPASGPTP